jgi:acyl transferase domain-containing protein
LKETKDFAHSNPYRNGKGPGINHPGPEAQEAVIRKAYAKAGLGFSQTGYFECHGTGTAGTYFSGSKFLMS